MRKQQVFQRCIMVQGRLGNAYGLWFTTRGFPQAGIRLKLRFTAIGAKSLEKAQSAPRLHFNLTVVRPAGTSSITPRPAGMLYPEFQSWLKAKSQPLLYQRRPRNPETRPKSTPCTGRPGSPGLCHGQVLPLCAFDEGIAARNLTQRAEHFLNTFYFQYGPPLHCRLAHGPSPSERVVALAAISPGRRATLEWPGKRSTRYPELSARAAGIYPIFQQAQRAPHRFHRAIDDSSRNITPVRRPWFAYLKGANRNGRRR